MNRFVQKLIAGAAAVAIAVTGLVGGASTAKAADPVYSITLNKQPTGTADHTFNGWQLAEMENLKVEGNSVAYTVNTTDDLVDVIENAMDFDARIDGEGEPQNVLVKYKKDGNYYFTTGSGNTLKSDMTKSNPIGYLIDHVFTNKADASAPWSANDSALRTFAQKLNQQAMPANAEFETFTTANGSNKKDFTKPGIWFLKDATTLDANAAESLSIPIITPTSIENTNFTGTVTVKNVIPTISKHLADANGNVNNEPSFKVGDDVYYTLETTVPYYTGYATPGRVFQITDTASAAISSIADGKATGVTVKWVKVGDTKLNNDGNQNYTVSHAAYSGAEETDPYKGGVETTIDLSHYVNSASVNEGAKVVVLVKATLDSDALLSTPGDIKPNPNKDSLTWSHNPNDLNDKRTIPGNEVNVYSYKFNIVKTAKDMATKLQGAKFTIKAGNSYLGYENGAWKILTTTPTKDTQGGAEAGVFTTDTEGVINFDGLDAGTYEIEEIVPPNDYTAVSLPKFNFTVSATVNANDPEGQKTITTVSCAKDAENTDSRVSVDSSTIKIWNAKNLTELPMTGDLGIKVFITVGVLLMAAGAAFALSARMRS